MATHAQQRADAYTDAEERERVREALLDLCFERDFAHVTVEALCERAALDHARFERMFGTLEGCFHQIYGAELERYRREAAAAREGAGDWRGRVRATAYALYRFLVEDERVRKLTAVEVRGAGERAQLLFGEELESLFDLIDEGRLEPGAPASLTRATAEQVGGGIFDQIYAAAGVGGPVPGRGEIVPKLMYAAVLPYLGARAAAEELEIPPPAAEAGAEELERIREALLDLCFERRFSRVTVEGLCRRAGVERSVFERSFADLEACFLRFYEPEMRSFCFRMTHAGEGRGSWRDRLRATAYDLYRFLTEDERRAHFVLVESRAAGERAQLIFAEGIEPLFDLLDEGRREMGDPEELSRSTAEQIGGGIFNAIYAAVARRLPLSIELVPQMMYTAVLPYLGSQAAAEELEIPPPPDLAP